MFVLRNFMSRAREKRSEHWPWQSSVEGFQTARSDSQLFTPTTPKVDGEECLRDCEGCVSKFPAKFHIDESKHLYGNVKPFQRHLIVATGKSDWTSKVHNEEGSVMQAMSQHDHSVSGGRLMMSASNMPVPDSGVANATRCLLLPAFVFIDNVTPSNVPSLIDGVINPASVNISKLGQTSGAPSLSADSQLMVRQCPYDYLVLLCSHKTRDARCGQSAPIIKKELERHLRPLGLLRDLHDDRPGGVGIYFVSHVGGHKFAANVLVYRRAGTPGAEYVPEETVHSAVPLHHTNGTAAKMVVHETISSDAKVESLEHATLVQPNGAATESNGAPVGMETNGTVAHANGESLEHAALVQPNGAATESNGAPVGMEANGTVAHANGESLEHAALVQPNGAATESNGAPVGMEANGTVAHANGELDVPSLGASLPQNGMLENGSAENTPEEANDAKPGKKADSVAKADVPTEVGPPTNGVSENGVQSQENGTKPSEKAESVAKADVPTEVGPPTNGVSENGMQSQENRTKRSENADSVAKADVPTEAGPPTNGVSENGVQTHENGAKSQELDAVLEEKRPEVGQCIWLSRVRPEDCENIVRYTILKGKVVKPGQQLRGGFDRCKQIVSW